MKSHIKKKKKRVIIVFFFIYIGIRLIIVVCVCMLKKIASVNCQVPNSIASTRTYKFWPPSNTLVSINSPNHLKQPTSSFTPIPPYAVQEQFSKHCRSHSFKLSFSSTRANELSRSFTFSTFTNSSPLLQMDALPCFFTHPLVAFLADHSLGDLGSNPGRQVHSNSVPF